MILKSLLVCYNSVSILCFLFYGHKAQGDLSSLTWHGTHPPPHPTPNRPYQKVKSEPLTTRKVPSPISLIIMAVKKAILGDLNQSGPIFSKKRALFLLNLRKLFICDYLIEFSHHAQSQRSPFTPASCSTFPWHVIFQPNLIHQKRKKKRRKSL